MITTLLLRGAQTPGELRTRTNRMYEFADVTETEEVLNQLAIREDGPFVVRLAREPGRRESRFMHLFSGDVAPASAIAENAEGESSALEERVAQLERQVIALTRRLDEVLIQLDD